MSLPNHRIALDEPTLATKPALAGARAQGRPENMSYASEFATVDAVLACGAETSGVDAFALSLIKAERQIRKLFTHLVFQAPAFGAADVGGLRKALADNRQVYFAGFIAGWDALYPCPVASLVGQDYQRLLARLAEATGHRNKIFHGQLTNENLSTGDLLGYVDDMVRPERRRARTVRRRCCIGLAGGSPAAVSAGAPRSRLRVTTERSASERSVRSPAGVVWPCARGANLRAQCESVNFAAS